LMVGGFHGFRSLREKDTGSLRVLAPLRWHVPRWMPDGRRLLARSGVGYRGFDVATNRRLGTLIGLRVGSGSPWICIGPDGHYRGWEGIEEHIVYVAQTDEGHTLTLPPAAFQQRFGWKNEPAKARLMGWD